MTKAHEQGKTELPPCSRSVPLQLYRVSIECKACLGARIETEFQVRTNAVGVSLRQLSLDLSTDGRRLLVVANIACRLSVRVVLAELVRWLPRDPAVLNVCWESLPRPDEDMGSS